ncbi:nucleolar protein 9, partial [Phenoliferia sp. Uapishka_3]
MLAESLVSFCFRGAERVEVEVEGGLPAPRPRQRQGADAKKAEKQAKREREEQEARAKEAAEKRARYRKTEMAWDSLDVASSSAAPIDPDALPEVEPDTKAYFREVASKIQELEDLGHGRPQEIPEGEDEVEDDRPYLLRSALESLSGHEIPLAGDGETSLILEKLLYSMDDFARRVLADRFMGNYNKLVKHRAASHVLQTLFTLAGETVDRETRGIIATSPNPSDSDAVLPTMTALLLSALSEILPSLPTLIYDPFGSHTLRVLLLVFSGSPPAIEGRASAERSKKSLVWRKQQGPMKSFLAEPADEQSTSAIAAGKKREVPPPFADALVSMWESLIGLDEGGPKGEGVRRAAMDAVAGPAVRIMIEMEAMEEGGWRARGWADRIMCGLVEEIDDPSSATEARTEQRGEFLGGLLRHPASSPTFESLLMRGTPTVFGRLWGDVFEGKLHRLAGNAVANFVVAIGITRLDKVMLAKTVEEIRAVGTERRGEWIDNFRTGVLKSLIDRCAALSVCEKDVNEILLDTFQLAKPEDQKLVVPCVLSLNRLEYFKKLPDHVTAQAQTQGSILLQSWLKLASPHQLPVINSLSSLGFEGIMPLTQSATSSRVIDAFLSSPTTPPSALRKFLMSLIGHYHTLADDRIGSRVVERCWAVADIYLKDKIAASLVEHQIFLQQSSYGHFFARKLELPLWERRREQWKLKMAAALQKEKGLRGETTEPKVEQKVEEPKKRSRPVDEVDDIFAKGKKGNKTGAGGATAGPAKAAKVPRVEGFEDVFEALRATV